MDGICRAPQTRTGRNQAEIGRRISPRLFFMAVLIMILNMTDVLLTQFIIEYGGWEVNPISRAAMVTFGDSFWLWKHAVVSLALILLISHIHLHMARVCLAAAACLYAGVTLWQLILIGSLYPLA